MNISCCHLLPRGTDFIIYGQSKIDFGCYHVVQKNKDFSAAKKVIFSDEKNGKECQTSFTLHLVQTFLKTGSFAKYEQQQNRQEAE